MQFYLLMTSTKWLETCRGL